MKVFLATLQTHGGVTLSIANLAKKAATWLQTEISHQLLERFVMKSITDIHVPLRMNCNNFNDPLLYDKIPSKTNDIPISFICSN